jgi:membrane fusion protein, copper/silver efflux system
MKRKQRNRSKLGAVSILIGLLFLAACSSRETAHEHPDTYLCPMHPTVVSDKPGVCPVCGMDLVRKARPGEEVKMTEELTRLIQSPNEVVMSTIKTIRPEYKAMPVKVELQGVVSYDARQLRTIASRVGGRLEKVFIKYNFQPVSKGQKVAEVYSPELVNAQRELLFLLNSDADNTDLIESAKQKLLLLGLTEKQLSGLITAREVSYSFPIYSPYSGFVILDKAPAPVASPTNNSAPLMNAGSMSMSGSGVASVATSPVVAGSSSVGLIREGSYVNAGQSLFTMVNAQSVWLEWLVPASLSRQLKKGSGLNVVIGTQARKAKIDFAEPVMEQGQDFIRLRSYYTGSDVTIGQYVNAQMEVITPESLWLPKDAVLNLGIDPVVFVKERTLFKPKKIVTGIRSDGYIEIVSGLTSADELAMNAFYLVDSESFIKTTN